MGIEHLVRPVVHSMRYGQHKVVCPSCGPQRKKKGDKTLSVKVNDEAAVYQCWHCQEQGVIPLSDNRAIKKTWQEDRIRPVAVASKKKWDALSQKGIEFLASRGVSLATATKLGIKSAMAYVQAAGASVDTLVFSYMNKTEEYAAKLRWTGGKGFTSNGAPASLWNLQNVIKDDWLIICEGEMDAATLVEAGYESATSIPLGAVIKVADGEINPEEDLH